MAAPTPTRYRIAFAKTEAMRFTGHLDLHRTWERTFRRAGLPLAYSEGFNPHPRLNIGAALPLGCLSRGDLIDAWLENNLEPAEIERALRQAAPPGIRVEGVTRREQAEPVLQRQIEASLYEVSSHDMPTAAEMARRVDELMGAPELRRIRRGKTYDLRPLVLGLSYDAERSVLEMRLLAQEGAAGRPEEVLDALGLDPARAVAVRTGLVLGAPTSGNRPS